MKNTFFALIAGIILMGAVIGCSSINPFSDKGKGKSNSASNKTLTDKGVDTAVGEEKIGVPECDELVDMLADYANDPNDNFIVKAGKAMFVNKIRTSIKESVEKNKNDRAELAKNCKDFKSQLEKYKAEEDSKKKK
jgi:hypothetical protein